MLWQPSLNERYTKADPESLARHPELLGEALRAGTLLPGAVGLPGGALRAAAAVLCVLASLLLGQRLSDHDLQLIQSRVRREVPAAAGADRSGRDGDGGVCDRRLGQSGAQSVNKRSLRNVGAAAIFLSV